MKDSEKPIKYVVTRGFNEKYSLLEASAYVMIAKALWKKYPVDMLVFEDAEPGLMKVQAHGYHADTQEFIDKEVFRIDALSIKKFWLKYDDQGDFWLGTFLFPEEY